MLCRRIGVLKGDCVAIDGSKFKAVNNRDRNFTSGKIASRIAHLEASVERYIDEMVRIDRQEEGEVRAEKVANLVGAARSKARSQRLQAWNAPWPGRPTADLPDRSRCACDGNERAAQRHRRLQRADRGRYRDPSHRDARGHQSRASTANS